MAGRPRTQDDAGYEYHRSRRLTVRPYRPTGEPAVHAVCSVCGQAAATLIPISNGDNSIYSFVSVMDHSACL